MADPKEGYVSGIDVAVVGDVDSDGVFDGNTPKEGFNSGVVKYTSVTVDSDGVVSPAGNYLGIHRAVSVSVDSNGDYSSNLPKEGFNPGAYRYSTSTNVSNEGDIEGYGVILGTIDSSGDFQTYTPNAWLLNGTTQYQTFTSTLPNHGFDEAFLFTAGFTRAAGAAGSEQTFWAQSDFHFTIVINAANKILVYGHSGTANCISAVTDDTIADDDAVHALAVHADLSTASPVLTIVLDGNIMDITVSTLVGETVVDFQPGDHYCGVKGNLTNFWDGCLWNIGYDSGDSADIRDLTTQANIDAIMSGNQMKDPAADGSNYFGRSPHAAFFQDPVATSGANSGSGGAADDFTVIDGDFRCLRVGPDIGNPPTYVSMHLFGSGFVKNTTPGTPPDYSLDEFATAIEAEGPDRIGYYCDDGNQLTGNASGGDIARLNDWTSRGFHFGIEPIGSDSLASGSAPFEGPCYIEYDGVETGPKVTISNEGKTWVFETDAGIDHTFSDVSAGTYFEKLKWTFLEDVVNGVSSLADWTATINPTYGGSFDDSFPETLETGEFLLSGSPPSTIEMEFDQLRRKELEIDYSITTLTTNELASHSWVFFNPVWQTENATVETFLRTQSIYKDNWIGNFAYYVGTDATTGISQRISDATPISDVDPWEINMGIGLGDTPQPSTTYFKGVPAEYDALSAAEREHRVRLAAKGLSCEGAGAYVPIVFGFSGLDSEQWSPDEVVWLIDEFKKQQVQILLIDNAIPKFGG